MIAQYAVLALDVLLITTVIYLFALMRKLKSFHAYRNEMRLNIDDILTSTETARDAITKLKSSVHESQSSLVQYIDDARHMEMRLANQLIDVRNALSDLQTEGLRSTVDLRSRARHQERADANSDAPSSGRSSAPLAPPPRSRSQQDRMSQNEIMLDERIASLNDAVKSLRDKMAISS